MALAFARVAPLARRMRAWWDGRVLEAAEAAPPAEPAAPGTGDDGLTAADGRRSALFRRADVQLRERVWGAGFAGPGDAEWVFHFVAPLALDGKMTVAHLGAGLGGVTRAIASATGAWTTGYEAKADHVEAGMELSTIAGLAKRATLGRYDPPALAVATGTGKCHAVIAVDALRAIADKPALYASVFSALRLDGHFLFTDYLLKDKERDNPAIAAWLAQEPPPVHLASAEETGQALAEAGFDVRIVEEMSGDVSRLITAGWARFAETLARDGFDRRLGAALTDEIALWLARLRVLESGAVGAYRVHAIKRRAQRA